MTATTADVLYWEQPNHRKWDNQMPELPEVETIRTELLPWIVGRSFSGITILDNKLIRQISAGEFCQRLTGQRVTAIGRRGKYLLFNLSSRETLIIHLRMSGALLLNPGQSSPFTRAIFDFDDNTRLVIIDRRRLAVMWLVKEPEDVISKLGVEPLVPSFTTEFLSQQLKRHNLSAKAFLLDQSIIAGIGNMYADEALFQAEINPLRKTSMLSAEESRRLYKAIRGVLRRALTRKGASTDSYIRPDGQLGAAHFDFRVAHRGGKPCPICNSLVKRIEIRGRGSYFCPNCQKP